MMARCAAPCIAIQIRQIDLARADLLGETLDRLARIGVGLLPHWRAHQRKARRNRWFLGRTNAETRRGVGPRVGIGGVLTREDIENECEVVNRACEGTDVIELAG